MQQQGAPGFCIQLGLSNGGMQAAAGLMLVQHYGCSLDAHRVLPAQVNGMMIEDKIVFVGPFLKKDERPATKELFTNVYIKNLVRGCMLSTWLLSPPGQSIRG
jgi:hypothetical protein